MGQEELWRVRGSAEHEAKVDCVAGGVERVAPSKVFRKTPTSLAKTPYRGAKVRYDVSKVGTIHEVFRAFDEYWIVDPQGELVRDRVEGHVRDFGSDELTLIPMTAAEVSSPSGDEEEDVAAKMPPLRRPRYL